MANWNKLDIHATRADQADAATADATGLRIDTSYAKLTGATFTGDVKVNGNLSATTPDKDSEVATKKYVDDECAKATGTVKSVNKISPDTAGDITLTCYTPTLFKMYYKDNPTVEHDVYFMLSAIPG